MYFVYALKSLKNDYIYVGLTKNLHKRMNEHNSGRTKSTKAYRPWVLFYSEKVNCLISARLREKKLKSGSGKEFLRLVLKFAPVAQLDRATAFQ
ncbi:MAG TPA: GIY-YIG nuclease family protein [Candidatus Omnitrophota bacterium]|nr:GIY-YIG nuclease family protein [Candidatus Omnitrophota bacterium]